MQASPYDTVTVAEIQDKIETHFHKIKATLTCIMFALDWLSTGIPSDKHTLYHALWAVDDHLVELDNLFQQLVEK